MIGIKDSSGNKDLFAGFMKAKSPTFSVLVGNAQMFHHALMNGATGGILAAAMFAPALALDIYENHRRGDMAAADAAQAKLTPLGAKIVGELGVPGVKAAMDRVGLVRRSGAARRCSRSTTSRRRRSTSCCGRSSFRRNGS